MPVYKDKNGTWYAMIRYKEWDGKTKQKCMREFSTKREAQEWERRSLLCRNADMAFVNFFKFYKSDMQSRIKQNTLESK